MGYGQDLLNLEVIMPLLLLSIGAIQIKIDSLSYFSAQTNNSASSTKLDTKSLQQ